jgi:hypothetical protein
MNDVLPQVRRRKRKQQSKIDVGKIALAAALVAGIVACLVGIVVTIVLSQPETDRPFRAHVGEYLKNVPTKGAVQPGNLSGKMVLVDVQSRRIDVMHFELPERIRARKPAEVQVIARLKWERERDGHYELPGTGATYPGYRWDGHVEVIDRGTARRVTKVVRGEMPLQMDFRDTTGPKPREQVLRYLVSLYGQEKR